MFGYVRPLKGELRVREYETYKAVYCGLCHTLKARCGFMGRFLVNFDFTFLAMILSVEATSRHIKQRCVSSPLKKKCVICEEPALSLAADRAVVLFWWKLRDTVQDEGFIKSLRARIISLILRPAYRRAAKNVPEFDSRVRENLEELNRLENEDCESLDMVADRFAEILSGISDTVSDKARSRAVSLLLYHTGRIIYILDAVNDLPDDVKQNSYNPLVHRFNLSEVQLDDETKEKLKLTIAHSLNLMSSALQLLELSPYTTILENIIYLGIPHVSDLVFAGEWGEKSKDHRREIE